MKASTAAAACIATALVFTACTRESDKPPAVTPAMVTPMVFPAMVGAIIPASNKIWELAGNLYDDNGKLDAKRLTDAQWTEVKDAALAMGASAKSLAETSGIKVGPPGMKISGEGTAGAPAAADVQKALDADPKAFGEHATQLVAISDEIAAAATAHDAMKTDDAQGRLTDVCGDCHKKFWYPNQPAQ